MCDEAVDDCLAALKFIAEWSVTSKMLEKLLMLYTLMMIYSLPMKVWIKSHLLPIKNILAEDREKINLDNDNFDEDDPDSIIQIRFLVGVVDLKNAKLLKKISEELMLIA